MNAEEMPIELLEAQRQIRAKQVQVVMPPADPDKLSTALEQLRTVIAAKKRISNAEYDEREAHLTVEKLRSSWNAPERHVARTEFDPDATEWWNNRNFLISKLGCGFTVALVGKRGPGKTQLAVELMRLNTSERRSAYYCTAMDYFMRIKDAFHADRRERQEDAQRFFVKPRLLVVDEMNVRSDSAWEDNMLADLIGKRYNALLDTVLISNETAEQFANSVGPSIIDRLNETGGVIECNWKSFRS